MESPEAGIHESRTAFRARGLAGLLAATLTRWSAKRKATGDVRGSNWRRRIVKPAPVSCFHRQLPVLNRADECGWLQVSRTGPLGLQRLPLSALEPQQSHTGHRLCCCAWHTGFELESTSLSPIWIQRLKTIVMTYMVHEARLNSAC
jgi:hypothetical protein